MVLKLALTSTAFHISRAQRHMKIVRRVSVHHANTGRWPCLAHDAFPQQRVMNFAHGPSTAYPVHAFKSLEAIDVKPCQRRQFGLLQSCECAGRR